jgi:hypothetical protein
MSPAAGENAPCHRKNPITRAGNVQSNIILHETFICYWPLYTGHACWHQPYGSLRENKAQLKKLNEQKTLPILVNSAFCQNCWVLRLIKAKTSTCNVILIKFNLILMI